jgi:hypothetical protein
MSHHYSGPDLGFPGGDARLDFTDLYAFPKPGNPTKSILIMNVHPAVGLTPPGPTTPEPFSPEALYELRIDTDGDAEANIAFQVRFASSPGWGQTATLRRLEGAQAAATGEDGQVILKGAPVSTAREAQVTHADHYRFFAGWRSDPFFFDTRGAINNFQFTGEDFFAERDVCSIVLEAPNSVLAPHEVGLWARTLINTGFRRIAARDPRKLPSSLASKTPPIAPRNRRTTPNSSLSSRTRWSIRGAIHRRKQGEWRGLCCRTSCATIPRVQHPFRAVAGCLPTTSRTLLSPSLQMGR